MRWMFLGVLVVLIGLILSIGWMNDPSRWQGRQPRPDGQVGTANEQTLIPGSQTQPSQ